MSQISVTRVPDECGMFVYILDKLYMSLNFYQVIFITFIPLAITRQHTCGIVATYMCAVGIYIIYPTNK